MARRLMLVAAGLVLLAALLWLVARPAARAGRGAELVAPTEHGVALVGDVIERAEAAPAPTEVEDIAADDGLLPRRERHAASAPSMPRSARVRGRVVVAETGDPIEETLSIRLRTLDLARKEQLVTRADGTFESAGEFGRVTLLARVEDAHGRDLVDHEARFVPGTEEWLVPVPDSAFPTTASGRVVDARGEPLERVLVQLLPLADGLPYRASETDAEGRFALGGLRAGPFVLGRRGHWTREEGPTIALRTGPNELGELVLAEPREASLVVRFAVESVAAPNARILLCTADGREAAFASTPLSAGADGRYDVPLLVAAGRGTLTVVALDGRQYEPASQPYEAPGEVAVRVLERSDGPTLVVRDAATGGLLDEFNVRMRERGVWREMARRRFPEGASRDVALGRADEWIVFAGGYRAQRGTSDGRPGVVEVALARGTGIVLAFEDLEGPSLGGAAAPLEGVDVHAGEEWLGRSDTDGVFVLERELAPESLTFARAGWRVLSLTRGRVSRVGLARVR